MLDKSFVFIIVSPNKRPILFIVKSHLKSEARAHINELRVVIVLSAGSLIAVAVKAVFQADFDRLADLPGERWP
jgi:hypothetical protein